MNIAAELLGKDMVMALGWVIVHSLWQGAIVAVVLAIMLVFMRRFTSKTRYITSVIALVLIVVLSLIFFFRVYNQTTDARIFLDSDDFNQLQPALLDPSPTESGSMVSLRSQKQPGKIIAFFTRYFKQHFPIIVTIWFLGILIYLLRFMGGFAYNQRLKVYKTFSVSAEWKSRFSNIRERMKLKKTVKLLESSIVKAPAVIGHFKPVVLLPAGLITGLPKDQVEVILTHELAHILRKDYLINLFQSFVDILYFYHPAIRWLSGVIRKERENCCDDMAVSVSGDALNFARALADINTRSYIKQALAVGFSGKKGRLFMRVKRMVSRPRLKSNFNEGFFAACILFAAILIVAFSASASTGWNVRDMISQVKPESQEQSEANQESGQDSFPDIGFTPLVLEWNSRVELGGSIEVQKGKMPRFFSWIIEDKTGKVVWSWDPDNFQRSGDSYSFIETITLKKGQYKWYYSKVGISYSKILDDTRTLTKSPPMGPTTTKIAEWPPKERENIDKRENMKETPNVRNLDFFYEWKGRQRRIRAVIDHGCVQEFFLDNIKFLRKDIERNWDFVIKTLSEHEKNRFVYKKPRK